MYPSGESADVPAELASSGVSIDVEVADRRVVADALVSVPPRYDMRSREGDGVCEARRLEVVLGMDRDAAGGAK